MFIPAIIIQGLIGFILVAVGLFLYLNPPQNINIIFGYRTARAMKNQEQWEFAQKYSGKVSIQAGAVMMLLTPVYLFLSIADWLVITISLLFSAALVFYPILRTEKALKKRFPGR
jgi:uncharacterized membrane protein